MGRDFVIVQPYNTIEEKEGVFKSDFLQFMMLDLDLRK